MYDIFIVFYSKMSSAGSFAVGKSVQDIIGSCESARKLRRAAWWCVRVCARFCARACVCMYGGISVCFIVDVCVFLLLEAQTMC